MQKFLLTLVLPIGFMGCVSDNYPINNIPPKHTEVKKETTVSKKEVFRKDNHRYDKRYQNFDYDRFGYKNRDGLYYGYFDRNGYFFNNMYFTYDDNYTYEDRYNMQGPFSPDVEHIRVYILHDNNNWNRDHNYSEPNQYIRQFPYYQRYPRPKFRIYHQQEVGPTYRGEEDR